MTTKKRTKPKPQPKIIKLVTLDEDSQRTQSPFNIDVPLLERQTKTISKLLSYAHQGPAFACYLTSTDRVNLECIHEVLCSILDGAES